MAATKYLDHGLYAAYSNAPTFGTCQEGDGAAQGAATVATVSIDLAGFSASAGAGVTFTVGGAVLTCGSAGVADQFAAGTGSTLASSLATAINQTNNTKTITQQPAGWVASKIQDFFYAVASGTTLQIQSRAGSASINGMTAVSNGFTGGVASATFAGGASGAWGYVFNHSGTFGRSAFAIGSYGCWAANKPIAGSLDPGDLVEVRANKILDLGTNPNFTVTMAAMGTLAQPVMFRIDNGTVWGTDAPNPIFKIKATWTGSNNVSFTANVASYVYIKGRRYGSGGSVQRNLVMEGSGNGGTLAGFHIFIGHAPITWENLLQDAPGTSATSSIANTIKFSVGGSGNIRSRMIGCRTAWAKDNSAIGGMVYNAGANGQVQASFDNHEFVVNDCTNPVNPILALPSGGTAWSIRFTDCKFIGFLKTSTLLASNGAYPVGTEVSFRNCDFGASPNTIQNRGPVVALLTSNTYTPEMVVSYSKNGNREFWIDRRTGFCEWNVAKDYPTQNAGAKLLDGVTPWVIYAFPTTNANAISKYQPFELPPINKINTLPTGDRTISLNCALEKTLAWTLGEISFEATYIDSTGAWRYVDSLDPLSQAALTPDTSSTWSVESGGYVRYGGSDYAKKTLSISCPDVATGCEISLYIRLHTNVSNTTLGLFINPELQVV